MLWASSAGSLTGAVRPATTPMLSLEKLKVYRKWNGDNDAWHGATRGVDPSGITEDDWILIARLITGLAYSRAGQLSPDLTKVVEDDIVACTPDEATRDELRSFV